MAFPYLQDEEDPLLPNGTPRSLALAPAPMTPMETAPAPRPLPPPIVDYLTQQKAERDALVEQTNEVNPLALAFGGLSGIGAALQGRDTAGAVTNTLNLAKSGAANKLKQFDEKTRLAEAEKDRATKAKFDEANLAKFESEKSVRERENDPNSEESKIAQQLAKDAGYDIPGLTASKFKTFNTAFDKKYQKEQDKLQAERQKVLDVENKRRLEADLLDRAQSRADRREEQALRREEVGLMRQERESIRQAKAEKEKAPTPQQLTARNYYNSAAGANEILQNLPYDPASTGGRFSSYIPREFQSPEQQQYNQASEEFVRAVLRKESGAAISPAEVSGEMAKYFPLPGEAPAVVKQKAESRERKLASLAAEGNLPASTAADKEPPPPGTTGGMVTVISPKGKKKQIPRSQLQAALDAGGTLEG